MDKIYKLEIERNQYDRIAETFREANGLNAVGYDIDKDTVTFTISEQLRKRFAKFAKKKNRKYWITQMFLTKNIINYEVR